MFVKLCLKIAIYVPANFPFTYRMKIFLLLVGYLWMPVRIIT